jgi:tRNA (guanine-N7-)-methyltransferase
MLVLLLRSAFGLIYFLLQNIWKNRGKQNKLKGSRKTETFTNVFQPIREEVVGDLFLKEMEFRFLKNDNPVVFLGWLW